MFSDRERQKVYMGFDYQSFLNDKIFEELNKIKAFSPEVVEQEAAARKKPGFPHDKLVFAAADHNARMINEYKKSDWFK